MAQTLQATHGATSYAIEVAERCETAQDCRFAGEILRLLLGRGEPWERSRIGDIALEFLRTVATRQLGNDFHRLRNRLIEVGRPEAADIPPPGSQA